MRVSAFCSQMFSIVSVVFFSSAFAQQSKYILRKFVSVQDTIEFKATKPERDGFIRTYVPSRTVFWDIDQDSAIYIKKDVDALLCLEGYLKDNKREGVFNVFLIDNSDHSKRYRICEQTYVNDKLNGLWTTYSLHETLVSIMTFKDDSLNGISRLYRIDGHTTMQEREFFNGKNRFLLREFYRNGKIKSEVPYENSASSGIGKGYYENGAIQEIVAFRNGSLDSTRKYYYQNGQVWLEEIYKTGKPWKVVANYTNKGERRDAGTLSDGSGTLIFYNEDGKVREVLNYINGEQQNGKP